MLRVSFSFDGGDSVHDSYDRYRWIYVDSDDAFSAPLKENDKVAYENGGLAYTNKYHEKEFDYKINFVARGVNRTEDDAANAYLNTFMEDIHTGEEMNEITFYNPYKGVKIVGVYKEVEEKNFLRREGVEDCVRIELTLRVLDPSKCDFDYVEGDGAEENGI